MEVTEGALSAVRKVLESLFCDSNVSLSGVREPIPYFQYFFIYLGEIITHNLHTHIPAERLCFSQKSGK